MDEVQKALKERFANIHPLLFYRSLEKAKSNGELFDLLDSMPEPPVIWDENSRTWVHVKDVLQKEGIMVALDKAVQRDKEKGKKEKNDD